MVIEETKSPEVNLSFSTSSKSFDLPHGFQISQDGKSATKSTKVTIAGETKELVFTTFFPSKSTEFQKVEFLKQFNAEKVQVLGKISVELGLGTKLKAVSLNQDDLGSLKNIELFKTNGKSKTLNEEVFSKKEKDLTDEGKIEKLKSRRSLYHSIEKILKNDLSPLDLHKKGEKKLESEEERIQQRLKEIQIRKNQLSTKKEDVVNEVKYTQKEINKLKEKQAKLAEHLEVYYLNGKPVTQVINELMKKHKFTSQQEAKKFFDKFFEENKDKFTKSV